MKPQHTLEPQRRAAFFDSHERAPAAAMRRAGERGEGRRGAPAPRPVRMPLSFTEADKYRWILAHRGERDLLDALRGAASDADFDAQIEAAMRMSVASPGYFGGVADLPQD